MERMSEDQAALSTRYQGMQTAELETVARDYPSLTPYAQAALREEFARRGLEAPLADDSGEPAYRHLVTLRRYRDLTEAMVARSMLESAGITVYLRDENTVRLDWQISNFIGGMRLQVEESDAAAATELLDQPIPENIYFGYAENFRAPHCHHCGSSDIRSQAEHLGSAVASTFLLGIPTPTGRSISICNQCGARWEDDND